MSHYPDQYEADSARLKQEEDQHKMKLFYSNKLNGIKLVCEMIEIELGDIQPNEVKIKHMLAQVKCLSDE